MHDRGSNSAERTQKKVGLLDHLDQGTMASIINAIDYQFESRVLESLQPQAP